MSDLPHLTGFGLSPTALQTDDFHNALLVILWLKEVGEMKIDSYSRKAKWTVMAMATTGLATSSFVFIKDLGWYAGGTILGLLAFGFGIPMIRAIAVEHLVKKNKLFPQGK